MEIKICHNPAYSVILGQNIYPQLFDFYNGECSEVVFLVDAAHYQKTSEFFTQYPIFPIDQSCQPINIDTLAKLAIQLKQSGISAAALLVVVGDEKLQGLGTFLAATYQTGLRFIAVPTTTYSQINPRINSPYFLDSPQEKQLFGSQKPAEMILSDIDFLSLLKEKQFHDGLYVALLKALLFDQQLLETLEHPQYKQQIIEIIKVSLAYKSLLNNPEYSELRHLFNPDESIYRLWPNWPFAPGETLFYQILPFIENREILSRLKNLTSSWGFSLRPTLDFSKMSEEIIKKKATNQSISCIIIKDYQKWSTISLELGEFISRVQKNEQSNW